MRHSLVHLFDTSITARRPTPAGHAAVRDCSYGQWSLSLPYQRRTVSDKRLQHAHPLPHVSATRSCRTRNPDKTEASRQTTVSTEHCIMPN
eukprot:27444-Chlamydomonas_euryale.AAC.1